MDELNLKWDRNSHHHGHFPRGRVAYDGPFFSHAFGHDRLVRVYLPPSYEDPAKGDKRYPVLYAHDGQNLFSTLGPGAAFGWGPWEIDLWIDRLVHLRLMREVIVVAFDCHPKDRYVEYRGPAFRDKVHGADDVKYEKHKKFVCDELRPAINGWFRTLTDRENTGVMGSSMGGLASVVLAWERPDVFGLCCSVSPAFVVEQRYFMDAILERTTQKHLKEGVLKGRGRFRIYMDSGVISSRGGDDGFAATKDAATALVKLGWHEGQDFLFFVDWHPLKPHDLDWAGIPPDKRGEALHSQHNEAYWRLRIWRGLCFLYPHDD
ncbi:Alpha/Beta hydrolase protein [Hyaloraphidium curvatum]|nr:Alpha/Beta hydrolase protein [Hyaloraphidium curvatum]